MFYVRACHPGNLKFSEEMLTGDSVVCQVPGGFGANGGPNDGYHQHLHVLVQAYMATSVGWSSSLALRRSLDELQIGIQGSVSTKCLAYLSFCLINCVKLYIEYQYTYIYIYVYSGEAELV